MNENPRVSTYCIPTAVDFFSAAAMVEASGSKRKAEEVEEEPLKAKKLGRHPQKVW